MLEPEDTNDYSIKLKLLIHRVDSLIANLGSLNNDEKDDSHIYSLTVDQKITIQLLEILKFYFEFSGKKEQTILIERLIQSGIIPIIRKAIPDEIIFQLAKSDTIERQVIIGEDAEMTEKNVNGKLFDQSVHYLAKYLKTNHVEVRKLILYLIAVYEVGSSSQKWALLKSKSQSELPETYTLIKEIKRKTNVASSNQRLINLILLEKLPYTLILIFIALGSLFSYFINEYQSSQLINLEKEVKTISVIEALKDPELGGYFFAGDTIKLDGEESYYLLTSSNALIDEFGDTIKDLYATKIKFGFINLKGDQVDLHINYSADTTNGGQFIFFSDKIISEQFLSITDFKKGRTSFLRRLKTPPSNLFKFIIVLVYTNPTPSKVFISTSEDYLITESSTILDIIDNRFSLIAILIAIFAFGVLAYLYLIYRVKRI